MGQSGERPQFRRRYGKHSSPVRRILGSIWILKMLKWFQKNLFILRTCSNTTGIDSGGALREDFSCGGLWWSTGVQDRSGLVLGQVPSSRLKKTNEIKNKCLKNIRASMKLKNKWKSSLHERRTRQPKQLRRPSWLQQSKHESPPGFVSSSLNTFFFCLTNILIHESSR